MHTWWAASASAFCPDMLHVSQPFLPHKANPHTPCSTWMHLLDLVQSFFFTLANFSLFYRDAGSKSYCIKVWFCVLLSVILHNSAQLVGPVPEPMDERRWNNAKLAEPIHVRGMFDRLDLYRTHAHLDRLDLYGNHAHFSQHARVTANRSLFWSISPGTHTYAGEWIVQNHHIFNSGFATAFLECPRNQPISLLLFSINIDDRFRAN